jgi:hypothetical protein
MTNFPFRSLTCYRVKRSFTSQRSDDRFDEGDEVVYQESTTNHYDEIEICKFQSRISGKILTWHAHQVMDLENRWQDFLEPIRR